MKKTKTKIWKYVKRAYHLIETQPIAEWDGGGKMLGTKSETIAVIALMLQLEELLSDVNLDEVEKEAQI